MVLQESRNVQKKTTGAEEKHIEAKKSMEKQENKIWMAQKKEFGEFLPQTIVDAYEAGRKCNFFVDMLEKLNKGDILTDNMVAAIRKCMKNEKQPKTEKPLGTISLQVKPWWMKQYKLESRVITGTVLAESQRAWLIEGHADMLEGCTWCVRCGRPLTEPASMTIGMGVICADKTGVPYPTEILKASKAERAKIRKGLLKVLHNQTFKTWVPKSQAEVLRWEEAK